MTAKPTLVLALVLVLASFAQGAWAQKVTVVFSRDLAPYQEALQGFTQAGDFSITTVDLRGDANRVPVVLQAIQDQNPEGILVFGAEALSALNGRLPALPVVYSMVLNPITLPGRNLSGVLMQIPVEEQLRRIPKLLPGAKKIGVIYNPQSSLRVVNQAREISGRFGLTLFPIAIEKVEEIDAALENMHKYQIDALWSVVDRVAAQPSAIQKMIRFSLAEKTPFIGLSIYHVKAGAFAAFSIDYRDIGAQTAALTQKVMRGQVPANTVEPPRKVIIYVNAKTQGRLGLDEASRLPEVELIH